MNRHAARLLPLTAMLLLAAQAAQAETSPWYVGASQAFTRNSNVFYGVDDKARVLRQWAADRGVDLAETAYLGNDVNDLPVMALVGLAFFQQSQQLGVAAIQLNVINLLLIMLIYKGFNRGHRGICGTASKQCRQCAC